MSADLLVYQAKSFYNAYIALDQLSRDDSDTLLLLLAPIVVNGAFSTELIFKAILAKNQIEYGKEHNLLILFQMLPKSFQLELWAYLIEKTPEYADSKNGLDELILLSNAFVDWRYAFEEKPVPAIDLRFLSAFANAAIRTMLSHYNTDMLWRYSLEKCPFTPCFQGFRAAQKRAKRRNCLMDNNGKSRHSVWLSNEVWQEVDAFYKLDNCPTRNEFVEKALRQYCGRLHAERSVAYLPRALQEMLEGTLGVFGDRLGKMLFKLVVEHNMTNHLLGGDIDMTRDEYNKMRGSSVREVAATHGNISFRDVLLFHREE